MSLLTTQTNWAQQRRRAATSTLALVAGLFVAVGLAGCAGGAAPTSLPDDFPKAVEVPAGTVASAAKEGATWTASVKLDQDVTRQAALEQLTDNGFAIISETGSNLNDRVYTLASEKYTVRVGITTLDGTDLLSYTVAKRQTEAG